MTSRENACRSRSAGARPRLLLVSETVPVAKGAVDTGGTQRLDRDLQTLKELGDVDAIFLTRYAMGAPQEEVLRARWPFLRRIEFVKVPAAVRGWLSPAALRWARRGALSFFHARPDPAVAMPGVTRRVRAVIALSGPDLVFAFGIGAAAALLPIGDPCPPIVCDMNDVEHVRVSRKVGTHDRLPDPLVRLGAAMAMRAERAVMRASRAVLVCSDHDADLLGRLEPDARVLVVENTARASGALVLPEEPTALFVGIMLYPPNARAAVWLARRIWPLVRSRLPAARLVIVGEGGAELGIDDPAQGIEARGVVVDLESVYAASRAVVCPIREGSGTRVKLIEAALYGRPSVSTTVGAEGLAFVPGRDILIADTAAGFAEDCVRLLDRDVPEADRVAASALRTARELYSPEQRHLKLMGILTDSLRPASRSQDSRALGDEPSR